MELEFIDISRDEGVKRPYTGGGPSGRRAARPERRGAAGSRTGRNAGSRVKAVDPRAEQARIRRRKRRLRRLMAARIAALLLLMLLILLLVFLLYQLMMGLTGRKGNENAFEPNTRRQEVIKVNESEKPIITEDFISVNEYSRPGEALQEVNNIFVHYTANKETSAAQNRSYFENLGVTGETSASAHFIIGCNGEIIQCIPLNEIAYAVVGRNYDSVSIECCYLSEDGEFTEATYQALIRLSAWLLKEYELSPQDMRRHYDEGGKKCPLYYVEHEDAWMHFLNDLEDYIMKEQV